MARRMRFKKQYKSIKMGDKARLFEAKRLYPAIRKKHINLHGALQMSRQRDLACRSASNTLS